MDLIYQEICCSNISNGIFEDMKIDPRNKWRKADSLSLDRSSTDIAINDKWKSQHKLDLSRSMILEFIDLKLLGVYLYNWLIFWQNALYLQLGKSRMCLVLQEISVQA